MTIKSTGDDQPARERPREAPGCELQPSRPSVWCDRRAVGCSSEVRKSGEDGKTKVDRKAHHRRGGGVKYSAAGGTKTGKETPERKRCRDNTKAHRPSGACRENRTKRRDKTSPSSRDRVDPSRKPCIRGHGWMLP